MKIKAITRGEEAKGSSGVAGEEASAACVGAVWVCGRSPGAPGAGLGGHGLMRCPGHGAPCRAAPGWGEPLQTLVSMSREVFSGLD